MVRIEISGDNPREVVDLISAFNLRKIPSDWGEDARDIAEEINRIQASGLRKRGLSKNPADGDCSQKAGLSRYDGLTVEVTNRGKGEESR